MGYLLTPGEENLTVQSFENMLKQFDSSSSLITVDLRKTKFIDPFGLVSLLLLAKWLSGLRKDLFYVMPEKNNVNRYLWRMNFWDQAKEFIHIYPHPENMRAKFKTNDSDVLLELTTIKKEEDVEAAVGIIIDRMQNLIEKNLHLSPDIVTKFCVCLAEVCQNIPQHSGDWGFAAAQTYSYQGQPFIKLAVGDLGIGIKRSLWDNQELDWKLDRKAVLAALELGVSRYSEMGRGLGLSQVKKYVDQLNGRMHIRTGQVRLFFAKEKTISFKTPFFPGTQISIDLPGNR